MLPRVLLVFLLGSTLIASPAPTSVGSWEVSIVVLAVVVPLVSLFSSSRAKVVIGGPERVVIGAALLYVASILVSSFASLVAGTSLMAIFRGTAPYLMFAPIAVASIRQRREVVARDVLWSIGLVGAGQAIYLLGLISTISWGISEYSELIRLRVTVFEPRATVPYFLALPAIGVVVAASASTLRRRAVGIGLIALGVYTALSTQTRAQLLAIVVGMLVPVVYFASRVRPRAVTTSDRLPWRRIQLAVVPMVLLLVVGVFLRGSISSYVGSIMQRAEETGDNGRIEDEWYPAADRITRAGPVAALVGIGPGSTFVTAAGEARSYIHNQVLYALIFTGAIGLISTFGLVALLFQRMFREIVESSSLQAMSMLSVMVTIEAYVQLFAVHKLFSFNLMFMMIASVYCAFPAARSRIPKSIGLAAEGNSAAEEVLK